MATNTNTIQLLISQVPTYCGCQRRNGTGECTNPIKYRFESTMPVERITYACGLHYQMVLNEFLETDLVHRYYLSNRNHRTNQMSFTEIPLNPVQITSATAPPSASLSTTLSSDVTTGDSSHSRLLNNLRWYGVRLTPIPSNLSPCDIECTICQETGITNTNGGCIGECNHCFHNECIKQWFLKNKDTCPNCRSKVDVRNVIMVNQATKDHKRLRKLHRHNERIVASINFMGRWIQAELENREELTSPYREYIESYMDSVNLSRDVFVQQTILWNGVNDALMRSFGQQNNGIETASSVSHAATTPS